MSCEEYIVWMSGRIDGTNQTEEEALLNEHLASCPHCRQILSQMEANDTALRNSQMVPPASIVPNVMKRIRAEKQKQKTRSLRYTLSGLATAAVLFLVVFAFGKLPNKSEDHTQKARLFEPAPVAIDVTTGAAEETLFCQTPTLAAEAAPGETGACAAEDRACSLHNTVFLFIESEEALPEYCFIPAYEAIDYMNEDAALYFRDLDTEPQWATFISPDALEKLSYAERIDFPADTQAEDYLLVFCIKN